MKKLLMISLLCSFILSGCIHVSYDDEIQQALVECYQKEESFEIVSTQDYEDMRFVVTNTYQDMKLHVFYLKEDGAKIIETLSMEKNTLRAIQVSCGMSRYVIVYGDMRDVPIASYDFIMQGDLENSMTYKYHTSVDEPLIINVYPFNSELNRGMEILVYDQYGNKLSKNYVSNE